MDAAAETVTSRSRRAKNDAAAASASAAVRRGTPPRDAKLRFARRRVARCVANATRRVFARRRTRGARRALVSEKDSPSRRRRWTPRRRRTRRGTRTMFVVFSNSSASTDAAMEYAATYSAARRSAHEARTASRRKEAAELLAEGINPHETFRRRDEAARARTRGTTRPESARRARGGDSVAPTTRGGCIRAEARGGGGGASDARATRDARVASRGARSNLRVHARLHARGRGRVGRHGTRRGVCQRGVQRETRAVRNGDRAGRGGVARVAGEVSRRRTARRVARGARTRDARARGGETRREKAETGVGVEALGASDEASWSAYAPAHGASVLEVDDANDDATSNANDDATSNDAPSDPDAIERRKRRDAVLAIENARLLDVAASRMADPDRLYTRDPVRGATLAGAAFASNPSRVVFRDFAVGKRYRKRVTITNVSYGTSTFRVMAFPVEHRGSLGVEYDHPGNLSAGMSSRVTVTFAPKIAQTLHTTLSLSTTAGVVEIPVECHRVARERARPPQRWISAPSSSARRVDARSRSKTPARRPPRSSWSTPDLRAPRGSGRHEPPMTRRLRSPSPSRTRASPRGRHRRSRERGGRPRVRVRRRRRDVRAKSGSARGRVRRGGGGSMDTRRR